MTELESLRAEVARLTALNGDLMERNESLRGQANKSEMLRGQLEALRGSDELATIKALTADVERLTAERDALRPHAERYQWLRRCDMPASKGGVHCIIQGSYGAQPAYSGEELDAAIDAARAAKGNWMDHIENLLVLQAMFMDIPDERIVPGLTEWQCGTAYCIGGWVAQHPHFRALGVRTQREDGWGADWWEGNVGAAPCMPSLGDLGWDPLCVSNELFGNGYMFSDSLEDDTRAEINRRIEAALNSACDLS